MARFPFGLGTLCGGGEGFEDHFNYCEQNTSFILGGPTSGSKALGGLEGPSKPSLIIAVVPAFTKFDPSFFFATPCPSNSSKNSA